MVSLLIVFAFSAHLFSEPGFEIRAQLVPQRFATLSAQSSGQLETLRFLEGDSFSQGDELAAFDEALQKAQLKRANAELSAATQTAAANKRLRDLNSIGQVELELSLAEVEKASADLQYIELMIERCRMVAPYSGRVAEVFVQEKEFVQIGQPVLSIVSDRTPTIEFLAPSRWLSWLEEGTALTMDVEELQETFAAKVSSIGVRVDAVSQTVKVKAVFIDDFENLAPGMSGVVHVANR